MMMMMMKTQDEIDRIEPLSQKQMTKVYSSDKM